MPNPESRNAWFLRIDPEAELGVERVRLSRHAIQLLGDEALRNFLIEQVELESTGEWIVTPFVNQDGTFSHGFRGHLNEKRIIEDLEAYDA